MKIFRTTRKMQFFSLLGLFFVFALFALFLYVPFWATNTLLSSFGEASTPFPWEIFTERMPLLLPIVFGMFLLMIWSGISILAMIRAQLIFEEDGLTLKTLDRLTFLIQRGVKPFSIPYNQISNIRTSIAMGRIDIFDQVGRNHTLLPALFGSKFGENVLLELKEHVADEVFESGLGFSGIMEKWSKGNKFKFVFALSFLGVYLLTVFFDPAFSSRSWIVDAWQVEHHPWGYESVWTYSLPSEADFWVVGWHESYYRVYKFSNREEIEWELPRNLLDRRQYPQLVSEDNAGLPIVWLEDKILHYSQGVWKPIPYDKNLQLGDWDSRGVAYGELAWAIDNEEQASLLNLNAITGQWQIVPLPETAVQQKLLPQSMHRAVNGDILVLMQSDESASVYLLSEDQWKKQEYTFILPEDSHVWDYFLDDHDSLWVLLERNDEFVVEKISIGGKIQVTQLPIPMVEGRQGRYVSVIVDSSERLWIGGGYPYFMAVFTPSWSGEATELIRYTEDNSNYKGGISTNPVMLANGQIWSLSDRISSIDSNLKVLPAPLPVWFASLDWGIVRLLVMLFLLLIQIFVPMIYSRRLKS